MQTIAIGVAVLMIALFTFLLHDVAKVPAGKTQRQYGWQLLWNAVMLVALGGGVSFLSTMDSYIVWQEALSGKVIALFFVGAAAAWAYLVLGHVVIALYHITSRPA